MRMRANYLGSRSRRLGGSVERLARFSGGTLTHPVMFGGGFAEADVTLRARTIIYGYPSTFEEFADTQSDARWCVLAVSLPNNVANLTVDHRTAAGRPDVPAVENWFGETGDLEFDIDYTVGAQDESTARQLLPQTLRTILLNRPVQRMQVRGARLVLRAFDGTEANDKLLEWLESTATEILSALPGFSSRLGSDAQLRPFPRGITGPMA